MPFPTPLISTLTLTHVLLLLLLTTTLAHPTPPNPTCHCTISPFPAPPLYNDSLSNPDTLIPLPPTTILSPSTSPSDPCNPLGPSLEVLALSNPARYRSCIAAWASTATGEGEGEAPTSSLNSEMPISTTILLRIAAREGFQMARGGAGADADGDRSSAPSADDFPTEAEESDHEQTFHILCHAEVSASEPQHMYPTSASPTLSYQGSWTTLILLRIAVFGVLVTCVAEGVCRCRKWLTTSHQTPQSPLTGSPPPIKPPNHPSSFQTTTSPSPITDPGYSPGCLKKVRVYASPGWKTARNPPPSSVEKEKHEYATYVEYEDEDGDDEFNRPVM